MTWKTLAEALENALAQGMECNGDGAAGTAPVSRNPAEKAGRPKPAPVNRRVNEVAETTTLPAKNADANRWERTALPKRGAPPLAVRCHLVVVEGGRTTEWRSLDRPTYSAAREREGGRARVFLRLVHSNLANSPNRDMATAAYAFAAASTVE